MCSLSKGLKTISGIFFFSIFLITIPSISQSTVYSSADTPIFHTGGTTITSDIVIAASGGLEDLNVTLDITNTYDSDLVITLKAPDGTTIQLINRRGGGGDNFTATVLDDEAGSDISSGSAPFTGSYRPEMPLSLFDGKSITGTWELKIQDLVAFDSGILDSWSMDVTASAAGDSGDGTVYNSTDVPINNIAGLVTSDIVVADSGYLTDVNVTIDIYKLYTSDLVITLKAPDGTSVLLVNSRGGSGDHFTGTTLDDEASVSISTGTAPFAGTYTPEALLSSLDGKSITGTWKLEVFDPIANDLGDLNSWSVELQFSDPLADDGTLVTDEDTPGSDTLSATDSDGDSLTYSIVANAADGNVVIDDSATGDYTYTPDGDYNGTDFFTFKAVDSNSDTSNTATISITVNPVSDDPIATNGSLAFDEDTVGAGALSASDADRDRITYSLVSVASYGTVVVDTTTGAYTYTQDTEHWYGSDFFTFQAMDSYGVYSNIATVDITVNSVNDLPVATGDSKVTDEDIAVSGTAIASDPVEGDSITFAIDTDGTNGSATIDSITGLYTYTPDTDWSGSDSFTFVATDSNGGVSNAATINLTVNPTSDDPVTVTDVDGVYDYAWSVTMNGTDVVYSRSVATDSSGNAYVVGEFEQTVDFDSSGGVDEYTGAGWRDIYLTKINSDSSYGWTRVIGSDLYDVANDVAVDESSNVYMVGTFMNTVDFDPLGAGDVHIASGSSGGFLTKFSTDGTYLWTMSFVGTDVTTAQGVTTDGTGNIYVTGRFRGTVDFDASGGTDNHVSTGIDDAFVTKINSNGTYGWTKTFGDVTNDGGTDIVVDESGDIFISGAFSGTVDFDPSAGVAEQTGAGGWDIFLTKLDSSGNYIWTKIFGGLNNDFSSALVVDSNGNIFLTGTFWDTADFDPSGGVDEFTSAGLKDIFFTRIDSSGNYGWTKVLGSTGSEGISDMVIDGDDNIFVTGEFTLELDFDPGAGTDLHSFYGEFGYPDAFLTKLGTDGSYGWTRTFGGAYSESGHALAVDSQENLFLTGVYDGGDTDLNPTADVAGHINVGSYDSFLIKFNYSATSIITDEDTPIDGILNATDGDGDSLTYSIVGVASNGTVTITDSATGEFTYTPDTDYNGSDLFTFQVVDSNSNSSNISLISITILPVNDAPLAANGSLSFNEDAVGVGSASASDVEGDSFDYTVTDGPYYGILTFNTTSGDFSYSQITTDWSGSDYFTFTVTDSNGAVSNTATFDLTIDPVNDAPPVTVGDILETYNWTKTFGGSRGDWGYGLEVDGKGNTFIVGTFDDVTVDFDFGAGVDERTNAGLQDIFLTKINIDGSYGWTKTMGGTGSDKVREVYLDSNGNVYLVGSFQFTVDFDPGVGVDERTTVESGWEDIFITKFHSDGTYGWTKTFGGARPDYGSGISVDSSGNIFVTGLFEDTVDFDSGTGTDNRTSAGSRDIFLTKINSDGTYGWTKTMGGTGTDGGSDVSVDSSGNVFVRGGFGDTVDFDPTSGIDNHTSAGSNDVFLTKINSDGTYGWTKTFGGTTSDSGRAMFLDLNDNIFITGSFGVYGVDAADLDPSDFDPSVGIDNHASAGSLDMFLTKINSDGTYGWTKTMGGTGTDAGNDVSVDSSGNVFVTGYFSDTVDFDSGVGVDERTSTGQPDIFLTKFHSDGTYGWTKTLGSTDVDIAFALSVDLSGNISLAGVYTGTVDFDYSSGVDNHTSTDFDLLVGIASQDVFLTKISLEDTVLSVIEDGQKTGTLSAIDYDDDPLIFSIVDMASHGTITWIDSTAGTFTYTPDANYFGADSFTFKANDGYGDSNISTITVDVISVNDIPVAVGGTLGAINEDAVGGGTVTVSGADVEGDSIIFSLVTDASFGTVVINPTSGDYTYTPDNHWNGSDFFTFQVIDSSGGYSNTATINLSVNSVNDAPVATTETVNTDEDTEYFGTLTGSDPVEGSSIVFIGITPPTNGSMTGWNGLTGTYSYMPNENFYGIDSFTFMTTDGVDSSSIATITIVVNSVNDIPVAVSDTLVIDEDTVGGGTVTISAPDVEGDSVIFSLVADASYGTVVITSTTGDYTYTPNQHFYGSDAFTFQAIDSSGGYSNVATIDITVSSLNDPPVTTSDLLETYNWTKTLGGITAAISSGVSVDSAGNVYTTGYFWGTADFDPSGGTDSHTSAGDYDIFITKVNSDGSYGWTKTFGGTSIDNGNAISADSAGNVFVTGYFAGTVDFDSSGSTDNHTSVGNEDIFLTKIKSDGSYGWTKTFGETNWDHGHGVSVDSTGNVFITGSFSLTVDFDPSGSTDSHTSAGDYDIFLTKINNDGTYGWTRTMGGTGRDIGYGVSADLNGNIYLTGEFEDTAEFNASGTSDAHVSLGFQDIFITKISSDGSYGWTKTIGAGSGEYGRSVSVDASGNIFVTGFFIATVDFDPSGSVDNHTSVGWTDIFITKISSDGSYDWTKTMGGLGYDVSYASSVDINGDIYLTGLFSGSVDFNPLGIGDLHISNNGSDDIYITKIKSDGSYGWTKTFSGADDDSGRDVSVDLEGNIFLTGIFKSTVDFDPSGSTDNHTSAGGNDVFLTKISSDAVVLNVLEDGSRVGTLSASDADGDSLIYSVVGVASYGTVTIIDSTTGEFSYTPNADYEGSDFFTFKVVDSNGASSNISEITVDVIAVNDQFTLAAPNINTYQNTNGTRQIVVTDPDLVDSYTYSVITTAANGSVSVDTNGLTTYIPNTDYVGGDSFEVGVTDSGGLMDIVSVTVTVTDVDNEPPSESSFNAAIAGNASVDLSWAESIDNLGDVTYTVYVNLGTSGPGNCAGGSTVAYNGPDTGFMHLNLLNGTTYSYLICSTDTAGNVSDPYAPLGGLVPPVNPGTNISATPFVATDGISFASDDANGNGLVRGDGGSDANNLDSATGRPMADPGFEFKIVVKDTVSGAAPLSVVILVEDRATPGVYTPYDMSCSGDYTEGLLCSYETLLGAFSSGSYYFQVVLGDIPGTVVTSATFQMPLVSLLNGFALVGAARDIDASNLVATDIGCSDPNSIYRWVSTGLSTVNGGNKGDYALVDSVTPLKTGEGYFLNTATCTPRIAELDAETDIISATYEVTLQTGWNIISNPYNGNVMLSDIEVQKDLDEPMTWTDAVAGELVVNGIYYYNGSDWGKTYALESAGGVPDAKLSPWIGYWMYIKKNDATYKLIIPKP